MKAMQTNLILFSKIDHTVSEAFNGLEQTKLLIFKVEFS